jgi:hypothetical protein
MQHIRVGSTELVSLARRQSAIVVWHASRQYDT